jgi:UDP-glucose 4-epimerase
MAKQNFSCTVLGANGYIGRHFCYYLNLAGHEVFAYGKSEKGHSSLPDNIAYAQFDISDKNTLVNVNLDVDYIFVFSGVTGTKISFDQYRLFTEVNEIGLLNILDIVKNVKRKPRIVFPSSRLVYKGSALPLNEDDEKESKTVYAANKLNCEQLLNTYNSNYDIPFTIFRICVPYGNMLDSSYSFGTIGFFLNRAKSGQAITLFGDGSLKRTFTPIESLCEQIMAVSLKPDSVNEVYNIRGETLSLLEAAKLIGKKYKVPVEFVAWPKDDLKLESGDTVFDSSKIDRLSGSNKDQTLKDWINKL